MVSEDLCPVVGAFAHRRAYSIAEAAKLLGVHKVSVYRRIYSGEIKVLSGLGRLTIPSAELDKFLGRVEVYRPRKRKRLDAAGRTK
jgi:excisionase family DNA binding protein